MSEYRSPHNDGHDPYILIWEYGNDIRRAEFSERWATFGADGWTFPKDGGPAVSIRDVYEDKVIYEELPIGSMSMSAPLVCIQTERE